MYNLATTSPGAQLYKLGRLLKISRGRGGAALFLRKMYLLSTRKGKVQKASANNALFNVSILRD